MIKKILAVMTLILGFSISAIPAFAHAVVKPNQAGVGAFTDFTLGVPSEKDAATVGVKLMIPAGLQNISPIVKPGWKIDVKQSPDPSGAKDDDGNPAMIVSEIDWSGGQVPAHQKDFFMFSAQVPSKEGELDWKVEQTYSDGSVVSWTLGPKDQQPKDDKGMSDFSKFGPYSKTMVVNDLKGSTDSMGMSQGAPTTANPGMKASSGSTSVLVWAALALSVLSLGLQFRKR